MSSAPSPGTLEVPSQHHVQPARARHWVVTCANEKVYDNLLVPFLGSLMSVAQWDGQIVVFDHGLSQAQAARLTAFGIQVEPVKRLTFVNLDRFLHMASFAEQHEGLLMQWDADVWFTRPVFELFDEFKSNYGHRLVCNLDRVFQESCYCVAREDPKIRERVRSIIEPVCQEVGNILQCGFVAAPAATMAQFCRYLEKLIRHLEYYPDWNSDTVALNYFYYYHRDQVAIIDQRYNCLPDWTPERHGDQFLIDGKPMSVLHVTSPWRAVEAGAPYLFQTVHPQLYAAWLERLRP